MKCVPRKIKARDDGPLKRRFIAPATLESEIQQDWQIVDADEEEDEVPADGRLLRLTKAQECGILKELHLDDEGCRLAVAAVLPILGVYERDRLVELNALGGRDEVGGADAALSAIRSTIDSLSRLGPKAIAAGNVNNAGGDTLIDTSEDLSAIEGALVTFLQKFEVKQGTPGYPALERAVHALAELYKNFTGKSPANGGPFIRFCQSTLYPLEPKLRDLGAVQGMVKKVLRHRKKASPEALLIS